MKHTLSIVIPAYNAARFIAPCLPAVLSQCGPHHSVIIVDDGSTDDTQDAIAQQQRAFPHVDVRIIRQANQGVSVARNTGLDAATGDYILFVDADDMLLPGALDAIDAALAAHAPDVVACDFNMWRPDKPEKSRRISLGHAPGAICADNEAILCNFFADRHMYLWAHVFRREIYARQPQPLFPPGRVFEDVSVLARLLSECRTLYRLAQPTIDYRQHPTSITKAVSAKWCVDFTAALGQVKEYFEEHGASQRLRMHIDATACHFYIGIVKNSFQLGWSEGRRTREQVNAMFVASLFDEPETVLRAMENGELLTRDRKLDAAVAKQVRQALSGSLLFSLGKAASRQLKLWQRKGSVPGGD